MNGQPKLFDDTAQLLLPYDLMEYKNDFIGKELADTYLKQFISEVPWQQQKVMMYDKEVWTPRLTAWFSDVPLRKDDKRTPMPLTPELSTIKQMVENYTGMEFNGVLLNYYRDHKDSVAWHSDKDTIPGLKTEIASISLGEARHFDFRNKQNHHQQYSIQLQHGSLLLMKGDLQQYWEHRIAKSNIPMKGRINMTFRKIIT